MTVLNFLPLLIIGCVNGIGKKPLHYFIVFFCAQRSRVSFYNGTNNKEWIVSKNNMAGAVGSNSLTVRLGISKLFVTHFPPGSTNRIWEVEFRNQIDHRNCCRERRFSHELNRVLEIQCLVIISEVILFYTF